MRQLLTRNLGWKILSLALAFAIWVAVAREPELATSLRVPVEFKNMPDDLDFGTSVPDRVNVELRGQSGRLSRDNLAEIGVVLDLASAHPGERTYTIRASDVNLPNGVSFYRAIPSQVTLRFEQLISREVQITPAFFRTPEGYQLQSDLVTPVTVRLRGPEQRMRDFTQVKTDPIDLSGVVGAKEFRTNINVGDPQIRMETPTPVTVKVTLAKVTPGDAR
jgi:YbbR domain-containing protein